MWKQNDGEEATDICDGTNVKICNKNRCYICFFKYHTPTSKWRIRYTVGM